MGGLIIAERKYAVLCNRTAGKETILVLLQWRLYSVEKVSRVERAVAKERVGSAMHLVRPSFKDHIDRRTTPAEFSAHRIFLDAKFSNGLRSRHDDEAAVGILVIVHTV